MDDVLKQLRDHLAAAEKRERAADERARKQEEQMRQLIKTIDEGLRVLADTVANTARR